MRLISIDWLILLLYVLFVFAIAFSVRSRVKTGIDFLLTGRAVPLWICALAFVGASTSAPEVISLGALGARYGLQAAHFYGIAAIPAMVFAGVFLMPLYYGSKARSVPEFLEMRFDRKTRALSACLFAFMTILSSSISLYAIARLVEGLHVFDNVFRSMGRPPHEIFAVAIVLSALVVMGYVVAGGLEGAMYNQAMQFCVTVAGLLPLTFLGLKNIGGWAGLKAALPATLTHEWRGALHASGNPMSIGIVGLCVGLGLAVGAGYWCTNISVIQTAMASSDIEAARCVPVMAAIPKMLFPFLVIVPGMVALALPTPHSVTTVVTNPDGSIVHNIQVVSPEAAQGKGIVPAQLNPSTDQLLQTKNGQPRLNYDMTLPSLLLHYLPHGMLGLGVAALLACFMSGIAGNVTAFNTVFTYDLYQCSIRKGASEGHCLAVARWTAVAGVLLSVAGVYAVVRFGSILEALILVGSIVMAPLLATVLLGMFWKRATGQGAFVGLLAGTLAALAHHGLTLPTDAHPGSHGGWITVVHQYPSELVLSIWGAIVALSASAIVAVVVSLLTEPKLDSELVGLVHSLTPRPPQHDLKWWQKPETLGVAILIVALALNIFFA